jgi:hypothetical protein
VVLFAQQCYKGVTRVVGQAGILLGQAGILVGQAGILVWGTTLKVLFLFCLLQGPTWVRIQKAPPRSAFKTPVVTIHAPLATHVPLAFFSRSLFEDAHLFGFKVQSSENKAVECGTKAVQCETLEFGNVLISFTRTLPDGAPYLFPVYDKPDCSVAHITLLEMA